MNEWMMWIDHCALQMRNVIFLNSKQRNLFFSCMEWHPKLLPRMTCQYSPQLASKNFLRFSATWIKTHHTCSPSLSRANLRSFYCFLISLITASRISSGQSSGHRTYAPKMVLNTGLLPSDCSVAIILQLNLNQISIKSAQQSHQSYAFVYCWPCYYRDYNQLLCVLIIIFEESMKKSFGFSFPTSFIASNPAPAPSDDPAKLILPAEPANFLPNHRMKNAEKSRMAEESYQTNNADMTLNYSPEIPLSFQPKRELVDTSPFLRNSRQITPKKYIVKPYDTQIQVKVVQNQNKASMGGNSVVQASSKDKKVVNSQHNDSNGVFESVTYQEQSSRVAKKNENSVIKKLNFDFSSQATSHLAKQSIAQRQDPKQHKSKVSRADHSLMSNYSPQNSTLLQQIHELRGKLHQIEKMNATLGMQFQMSREKLLAKEADNQHLKEAIAQLTQENDKLKKNEQKYEKMQQEFTENRNFINLFCDEIQHQKKEIAKLEETLAENQKFVEDAKKDIENKHMKIRQQNLDYEIRVNNFQDEKQRIEESLAQYKINNEELQADVDKRQAEKIETAQAYAAIEKRSQELEHYIQGQKQAFQAANKKIAQQEKELSQSSKEIQRQSYKINFYEEDLRIKEEKIRSLYTDMQQERERHMNELMKGKDNSMTQLFNQRERHNQETKENQVKHKNEMKDEKQRHQLQLKNEIERHQEQLNRETERHESELKRINEKHSLIIAQLQQELQQRDKEIKELQESLKQLEKQIRKARLENESLKDQKKQLTADKVKLIEEADSLQASLSNSKKQNEHKLLQIQRFRQAQIEKSKKINELSTELAKTIQRYEQQKKTLETQLVGKISQLAQQQLIITQLKIDFQEQKQKNTTLLNLITVKESRILNLQPKIDGYERILASYKESMEQLKESHESKWQEMKIFYEEQFLQLESQLKDLHEQQSIKRNFKNFKKHILKHQTVVTSSLQETKTISTSQQVPQQSS